ncbi:DUF3221 domain-containing protein [Sporosarcina highlanderae]|uniref:DUF3221 domain-containing protein n=1 Tax=Sporosarcina highlanderae TaxID=3035916 RepID=A0ABT8JLW5_9BACL|nr:DUF3221 domain-containing protein [Sporosarcina highlanderae]MDN4606141.1 DUF3221 domain-containing protein [Sporosarcina highlanderae]
MKGRLIVPMLGILLLGACGTSEMGASSKNGSVEDSAWRTLKKVSGREIIAELKQSVQESPDREKAAVAQTESYEYKEGLFGKPTPELAEDMAVQAIEGPTAIEAVEKVYGGYEGFENAGILFFENQMSGATQPGIWIGVKNPDERVQKLLDELQPKVDAGEILAEPIYIFRSPHTQKELYTLQDKVAQALKGMKIDRGSYGLSVNTITGIVEINHDFLKPEQQKELKGMFPDKKFHFEQDGRMVAEPGESSIIIPEKQFTDTPVTDGGFILSAGEGKIFVAGGTEGAVFYKFPEADKLKVGQRVKVEASGGIKTSYPGQGSAKFVEIMPDYKPSGARLSESQAVGKVLEMADGESAFGFYVIQKISFNENEHMWIFNVMQDDEELMLEIEDK